MALSAFIRDFLNLHIGKDDNEVILESVRNNTSFRGANLWILACAILVCSVGLNVNSTAVIIGAMLISPLMGPILASGFALGIYDFDMLKRSGRNLLVATITSISVSAIYFYLSPFKQAQSELLARTSPTIYDVLIAFFCGLVGVIAITRVEKGNPIPGVAIATALMPPLCTAGYGLAIGNFSYFMGALFLYTINCVFICMSTFAIVKYLKFPAKAQVDKDQQIRVQWYITALTIIVMIPSIWFAVELFRKQKFIDNANEFIQNELASETIIYKNLDYKSIPHTIDIACYGQVFSKEEIEELEIKMKYYNLDNTILKFRQDENLDLLRNNILNELNNSELLANEKSLAIKTLQDKLTEYNALIDNNLYKEALAIFPNLTYLSAGKHHVINGLDSVSTATVALYDASKALDLEEKSKLEAWMKIKLKDSTLILSPLKLQ